MTTNEIPSANDMYLQKTKVEKKKATEQNESKKNIHN